MDNIDEKYKRGKIYVVKCKYDDSLIYVGSTICKLNKRFAEHRADKNCSLYQFVNDAWDNFYIELYEEYPCNNKKELEKREGEVIRLIGTINKSIPGRTKKEYREDNKEILAEKAKERRENNKEILAEYIKEYYENNKEKIAEQKKKYRENNKEIIAEKEKKFREKNKESISKKYKEYYENNKEKIKEKAKEKVKCDKCGSIVNRGDFSKHKKTKKCQEHKK